MIRVPAPVSAIVHQDQWSREIMIMSSPIRFGRGGRARFARLAMNHHAVIRGKTIWSPRANTMVRLWVRS